MLKIISPTTIAAAVIVVVLGLLLRQGYVHVENQGYQKAQAECIKKFDEYNTSVNERIRGLEENISEMAGTLIDQNQSLSTDIASISGRLKKLGPTTIIKEGKCVPAPVFVDSLNEAIDRANKR